MWIILINFNVLVNIMELRKTSPDDKNNVYLKLFWEKFLRNLIVSISAVMNFEQMV